MVRLGTPSGALFFLQLGLPILHQGQRLRAAFTWADSDEALAILRGRVFAGDDAAQRKAEQLLAAADLKRGAGAIHFHRCDAGEIEVKQFFPGCAPAGRSASAVGDLPFRTGPWKGSDENFGAPGFLADIGDPAAVRRERASGGTAA